MKYTKAKLPDICTIKTGKHDANHANKEGKYRFYTCSNQYSMCDTYSFTGESVIVPGNGDIGLVFYYDGEFDAYQRTYVLNDITILPKYLFYHMQLYWRNFNDQKKFGSTVKYVRMSNFTNYEISYPSIEEQERIVAKIEELFSDLDNAVETLNATKAQLEVYKQAVLKNAFDGKLTNNGDPEIKELASFIEHPRYGTSKKCDYQNDIEAYTEVYRIPNIDASTGTLDRSDLKYAKFDEDEIEKLSLKYGDILIIRSNGSPSIVGTAAMVREQDVSGLFAGYLIRIRISDHEKLSPKYLLRYLSSYDARRYIENVSKSTSGVNNVNAQEIKKIKVPYFKKEIQDQIIYAIDSRLSAYENIEKTVNDALQQASAMRQSILKQAFEGKL
ncbi:restriction endonuclease subunit S [Streptococcus infantis]|nr:restriction endonuclease subunit S [Streptococcus infantis]MBZ2111375.1 restriction endonuclease subunit S [Streptococcus infantis]MBZ2113174.1 restriction endonuclease subunit S [Streptococcus infantis]MBZ2118726.1 restriction endonuclease subunit S [Streptococcus infantis]